MPDVVYDRHYDVSLSIDIVKQLTQSVEQLSLRMDSGGWVLVTSFASKLGISTQELVIRARHYPSECVEFSVWKDSLDTKAAHLHAIRASFGHISWIRANRSGTFVTLTKFHTYCDLHVFIRPLFLDDIVIQGIATRQHQGYERMSTGFCTHIVLSDSRIDSMDRQRLGAESTDFIVVLDRAQMMLDRITIYKVNEVTFVATGPIPRRLVSREYINLPPMGSSQCTCPVILPNRCLSVKYLLVEEVWSLSVLVGAMHPHAHLLYHLLVGARLPHAASCLIVRVKRPPADCILILQSELLITSASVSLVFVLGGSRS